MATQTFKIRKEKYGVPEGAKENLKAYNKIKRKIKKALKEGKKNINEIAEIIDVPSDIVTYNLMTMLKFGDVVVDGIDEDDEYYFYNLKK
ncbi:MAG: hypothetical protein U9N85_02185 [Bacteroidota bacterium]|nr:hypothetical protein [Bacteroidota bacterium]